MTIESEVKALKRISKARCVCVDLNSQPNLQLYYACFSCGKNVPVTRDISNPYHENLLGAICEGSGSTPEAVVVICGCGLRRYFNIINVKLSKGFRDGKFPKRSELKIITEDIFLTGGCRCGFNKPPKCSSFRFVFRLSAETDTWTTKITGKKGSGW